MHSLIQRERDLSCRTARFQAIAPDWVTQTQPEFEAPERSGFGFRLAQPGHAVAGFPQTASLENLNALEAFKDIPFCSRRAGGPKTAML